MKHSFREVVGKKVMSALKRNDDGISFSCVDFLCALMQPMHDNFDLRQEQLNKRSLLSNKGFLEKLLQPLKDHVVSSTTSTCTCGGCNGSRKTQGYIQKISRGGEVKDFG